LLSIRKMHVATVQTVARKITARNKLAEDRLCAIRAMCDEPRRICSVLADSNAADKGQLERGIEKIDAEVQAE
jgi:hypothetical protein